MSLTSTTYTVQMQAEDGFKDVYHSINGITGERHYEFISRNSAMNFIEAMRQTEDGTGKKFRLVTVKKTVSITRWE